MKIVIIGDGTIGGTLAERLSSENHEVTLIDTHADVLSRANDDLDVLVLEGDAASSEVQIEAGIPSADLVIACTGSDELNLFCCLIAKKLGAKHTISRVRNPVYANSLHLIRDDLGLSMSINPERECAAEMARVLRFPSAIKIDTFARGQVEILTLSVAPNSLLDGVSMIDIGKLKAKVLVCAVERGEHNVYIPSGEFRLQAGDRISIVASAREAHHFFRQAGVERSRVRQVMLIGGGRMCFYLAERLLAAGMDITVIESDPTNCERLSQMLPEANVIHGDGTDQHLLQEEGIAHMDAVVTVTGDDEDNILISLYAKRTTKAKIITKVSQDTYENIVGSLDLDSVFHPRHICADNVVRYVRALQASDAYASMETMCKIANGKVEALEFRVRANAAFCGVPLQQLSLKNNLLIGSIIRNGVAITPKGGDSIQVGDSVIVVTSHSGLTKIDDIFAAKP